VQERFYRVIASQLRRPSGRFGRWVMTRALNQGNAELIEGSLGALELRPDDRYLDAGFGGGRSIELAAKTIDLGHIYGVDYSSDMVTHGQRRFRKLIQEGRLSLLAGDFLDLPFRDHLMSAVSTINTIYFWAEPPATLSSFRRILRPGGRLAVGFSGAEKTRAYAALTHSDFRHVQAEEVVALVSAAGFDAVRALPQRGKVSRGDFAVVAQRADE